MVEAAFKASWVFTDLGDTHIDRFILINQWAKDETGYGKNTITQWKKGTYLPSINKTVRRDSVDYGGWQVNDIHADSIKIMNSLYKSGVINFKVKHIEKIKDVMDVPTNCAARCIVETDRKKLGWEWKHIRDHRFNRFLHTLISELEKKGLYDKKFVEKYYNLEPIKVYSLKK